MITRHHFLRSLAGIGAGATLFGFLACTKSDGEPEPGIDAPPQTPIDAPKTPDAPNPDAPPSGTCATTNAVISGNHGHMAVVPGADVAAGIAKTYDIQGGSGHAHTITVTPAMFTMLKAGQMVVVASSTDAQHSHNVTIACA